jgi:hypothetical protein
MVNAERGRPKAITMLALAGTASALNMCQANQPEVIAYVEPPAVYCYHTLAEADCYAEPTPGEYNRMIGFYGPPPPDMPAQQRAGVTITKTGPGI